MKKTIALALAGAALMVAPLAAIPGAAQARPYGFHGGFRGGFYGGYGGFYGYGPAALAFGLGYGLGYGAPWYYGPAYYDYYGFYGPGAVVYSPPVYGYAPPPTAATAAPQQSACGQWSWDQTHSKYDWIPGPCASSAPPPPPGAGA
jgi:hypothetical protein